MNTTDVPIKLKYPYKNERYSVCCTAEHVAPERIPSQFVPDMLECYDVTSTGFRVATWTVHCLSGQGQAKDTAESDKYDTRLNDVVRSSNYREAAQNAYKKSIDEVMDRFEMGSTVPPKLVRWQTMGFCDI